MRVLVVHSPSSPSREIRQAILGAGGECSAEDCVAPRDLAARLAQVPVKLVVVKSEPEGFDVETTREALSLVSVTRVAVGGASSGERAVAEALECGEIIAEEHMRSGLETVIHRLIGQGSATRPRGTVIAVYAPLPGSGGTTVASNLAGAFAAAHPKETALVELARDFGDLGLLLNVTPAHTARDACMRWRALDRTSLENSFEPHASGANVLVNGSDVFSNEFLTKDAVRRLAVLSRFVYAYSVFALESRLGEEELEVMRLSDRVVMVIRPDVVAVRRARWALDTCEQNGISRDRMQLVVNRWGQPGQLTLQQIETTLGMKILEQIPDDPSRLNQATNQGVLLQQYARRASISRKFDALATKLNGRPA
jgi:pilus assembly protein CpaE